MEDRIQDEAWIVRMDGYAIWFVKRTKHLHAFEELCLVKVLWSFCFC